ncbi:MAG: T9SS type A sorting domain-containing protein, partial [Ferruginibacter sp.]
TLTYQWKKNTIDIPGATAASFTINPVTAGDAANYTVVVNSSCGSTTSNIATLTILPATSIATQPSNQIVCTGSNATFSVVANGNNLTYQWRKAAVNIVGANASSFTITAVTAGDVGNYDVVITGTCGVVTSVSVSLTLGNIVISSQPASQTVCAGTNVSFSVIASGTGLTYQWRKAAVNIAGATSATFTITGITAANAGSYDVVINGTCGTLTSNAATLTVNAVTTISTQPVSQTVCAGSNVSFSVAATGTALTYQWRKATVNISGATSSAFTITGATISDAGSYDIVVNGTCGSVTSSTASLSVGAVGTWLGITNTDWNTASNWCGGLPGSASNITIPSTAPNMPTLAGGTGTVGNITINSGATLTIGAAGILDLFGSVTSNGTFNATAGSINFQGSSSQSMPAFTTTNVTMNGSGGVLLGGNAVVNGTLNLTNGNITVGTNNLSLANSSNGSVSSHIITNGSGNVIVKALVASTARTIPVGTNAASYTPLIIAANAAHTTDDFTVRVLQGVLTNGTTGTLYTDKVVDRTWLIDEAVIGGSNVNLTMQWNEVHELTGFDRSKCYVMQFTGGAWVTGTSTAATGADPYTQTKNNVTSFSPFAVQTTPIPRPLTGIYPNPVSTNLNVVLDLSYPVETQFWIYDAAGKLVYSKPVSLSGGLSQTKIYVAHLSKGVYTLRVSTFYNPEFLIAEFIKN